MITGAEIAEALPIIASLVAIESLLSVDNALAVAAMASHLPKHQQKTALRMGILGAYLFRGIALAVASWIVRNEWIKIIGAVYLVYLMCSNVFCSEEEDGQGKVRGHSGLFMTILKIEILDLSLSLDNVIAAVAMSRNLWIVCAGVFIGILALRFLAGFCIRLLHRFPALGPAAFVLVGYVGLILSYELAAHVEVSSLPKFVGIVVILSLAMLYQRFAGVRRVLNPVFAVARPLMRAFAFVVDLAAWPLRKLVEGLAALVEKIVRRPANP